MPALTAQVLPAASSARSNLRFSASGSSRRVWSSDVRIGLDPDHGHAITGHAVPFDDEDHAGHGASLWDNPLDGIHRIEQFWISAVRAGRFDDAHVAANHTLSGVRFHNGNVPGIRLDRVAVHPDQ